MPKRLIRKITPNHDKIRNHRHLKIFGTLLHNPNIWHLNRRSVSGAFGVGLFWALIPIPLQMLASAASAIILRVNLPLAVALVWLTNPLTMGPVFFINYRFGAWLLNRPPIETGFQFSFDWIVDHGFDWATEFMKNMDQIWVSLFVGSFVLGILLGLVSYGIVRLLWRLKIISRIQEKRQRRKQAQAEKPKTKPVSSKSTPG